MQITYRNTRMDKISFSLQHQFRMPLIQGVMLLLAAIYFLESLPTTPVAQDILLTLLVYCLLWAAQALWTIAITVSRKDRSLLTEHVIELRAEGLIEKTSFNHTIHYWIGLMQVVERSGYVGIYISPGIAHIVPDHAFNSWADRLAFIARIRQEMSSASSAKP